MRWLYSIRFPPDRTRFPVWKWEKHGMLCKWPTARTPPQPWSTLGCWMDFLPHLVTGAAPFRVPDDLHAAKLNNWFLVCKPLNVSAAFDRVKGSSCILEDRPHLCSSSTPGQSVLSSAGPSFCPQSLNLHHSAVQCSFFLAGHIL